MDVEQVMTRDVVTVAPERPLRSVAALLAEHRISGVPVVENGSIVGVVSEVDLLFKERGEQRAGALAWILQPERIAEDVKLDARTAREAMSAPALTIEQSEPVWVAAALMLEHGVSRLPVLDRAGRLAGIVTRADLVRAFVRSDEEIELEIRESLIAREFSLEPATVSVTVRQGEVTLSGQVENEALASLLPDAARRVPGVIRVRSQLTHREEPAVSWVGRAFRPDA